MEVDLDLPVKNIEKISTWKSYFTGIQDRHGRFLAGKTTTVTATLREYRHCRLILLKIHTRQLFGSLTSHGGPEIIRQKSVYNKSVKIRITLHNLFQPIASPSTCTLGSSVRKRSINNNNNLHSVTIHWKKSHRYSRTNQAGYTCKKPLKMEAKCEQDLFSLKHFQEGI